MSFSSEAIPAGLNRGQQKVNTMVSRHHFPKRLIPPIDCHGDDVKTLGLKYPKMDFMDLRSIFHGPPRAGLDDLAGSYNSG